jgi:tRNA modification GTPase
VSASTIVALATAPGPASVGIIRLSGTGSLDILCRLTGWEPTAFIPRQLHTVSLMWQGVPLDRCLVVWMPAPHSYTGEDVVELHCHGSPPLLQEIITRAIQLGACPAQPGEYTERAFLNGKLDLAQAEAIQALIFAQDIKAAERALSQLKGELSDEIRTAEQDLVTLLAEAEGTLDFPEEVDWNPSEYAKKLERLSARLDALWEKAERGEIKQHPPTIVIVGRPNVGKSSLLNALLGQNRMVVTPVPGTTRDSVEERMVREGRAWQLVDTAGLGKAPGILADLSVAQTRQRLAKANLALWLVDLSQPPSPQDRKIEGQILCPFLLVGNKADLAEHPAWSSFRPPLTLRISALTLAGLPELLVTISQSLPAPAEPGQVWLANHYQRDALCVSRETLREAMALCPDSPELMAVLLRQSLQSLGSLSGKDLSPEVLRSIFSQFCIGK